MLLPYAIFALVIHDTLTAWHEEKANSLTEKFKERDDVMLLKYHDEISNHISPLLPYPYREQECRDVSKACAVYKEDGLCEYTDWRVDPRTVYYVMTLCAKTCGFCKEEAVPDEDCVDLFQSCQRQKTDGQCNAADPFILETMKLNCKKTCGFCDELSNELPVVKPREPRELQPIPNDLGPGLQLSPNQMPVVPPKIALQN